MLGNFETSLKKQALTALLLQPQLSRTLRAGLVLMVEKGNNAIEKKKQFISIIAF